MRADGTPERFGRARHLTTGKRIAEVAYDLLYAGGWPVRLARPLGLAGRFAVAEHEVTLPRLADAAGARAARTLRVAFASDFHAGPSTHPRIVELACRALADARPDLLLLGGDFIAFHARYVTPVVAMLADVPAPLGRFAVLGNHDLIGDDAYLSRRLADAGIRTLVNASARLAGEFGDVHVCGLDDPKEGAPDGAAAIAGTPGTRLVLMHAPAGLRQLEGHEFAMAFCGHVHGGQFWIGDWSPVRRSDPIDRQYTRGGMFEPRGAGRGTMLVSRGLGQTTLPLRRGADPQVHVCTLHLPGT